MVVITKKSAPSFVQDLSLGDRVNAAVQRRLTQCCYARTFCTVGWEYREGLLILSGCVPSFYLKQVLQEILRDIEHVERIKNNVEVVGQSLTQKGLPLRPATSRHAVHLG